MKAELTKQFIKKTIRKVIMFIFIMIVVSAIGQSVSPMFANELALGQMQNSNEAFVLMNAYNRVKPIIDIAYLCATLWFMCTLGRDTYKFTKSIHTETEKEN